MILNQSSSPKDPKIDPNIYHQTSTRLALGEQLYSKNLTKTDLEKIPLVSSSIAEAIINQREDLIKSSESNIKRLEAVKGIGEKKARTISEYLVLD